MDFCIFFNYFVPFAAFLFDNPLAVKPVTGKLNNKESKYIKF